MVIYDENGKSNDPALKDFFISYAVENWKQATWIHQQLEDHGYHTILAGRDFKVGNKFVLEIDNALKTSAAVIAVMSPDCLASQYTQAEWAAVFRLDPTGEKGLFIVKSRNSVYRQPMVSLWYSIHDREDLAYPSFA